MSKYINIFKNLALIVLALLCLKFFNDKRNLEQKSIKDLQKQREQSEKLVVKKELEIQRLRDVIQTESNLIDESIELFNQLQDEKRDVETVYVEKIKIINNYDANQLKKYFDEELN